jgi:hypothetical protein
MLFAVMLMVQCLMAQSQLALSVELNANPTACIVKLFWLLKKQRIPPENPGKG